MGTREATALLTMQSYKPLSFPCCAGGRQTRLGVAGARFDLLKCIDMRHSRELDEQVRKYVPHPDWIGDKPNRKKGK